VAAVWISSGDLSEQYYTDTGARWRLTPECRALRYGVPGEKNTNWTSPMKPIMTLTIGGLIVALFVGYFYYERTSNDVTIQLPKVSLTK
jgi:hypothetical protein